MNFMQPDEEKRLCKIKRKYYHRYTKITTNIHEKQGKELSTKDENDPKRYNRRGNGTLQIYERYELG